MTPNAFLRARNTYVRLERNTELERLILLRQRPPPPRRQSAHAPQINHPAPIARRRATLGVSMPQNAGFGQNGGIPPGEKKKSIPYSNIMDIFSVQYSRNK